VYLEAILLPGTRLTEIPMHLTLAKPLFAWDSLEDSPSLATVKTFLASIPDARLLDMLRRYRGRGRDDEEERHVPKSWNVSRFLDVLGREPHLGELRRIFDAMVQRLGLAVSDLGPRKNSSDCTMAARRSNESTHA